MLGRDVAPRRGSPEAGTLVWVSEAKKRRASAPAVLRYLEPTSDLHPPSFALSGAT